MKTHAFKIFAVVILFTLVLSSCDNDDDKKDYSLLFKNTVWTGEFSYTGTPAQPVSIEFTETGQLTWHELAGDALGTWVLNDNKIVINLPAGKGFKAEVSDDKKFKNIENLPANNWALVNAQLNDVVEDALDLSVWTGTNVRITFKAGSKLDLEIGPTLGVKFTDVTYTRKGKSIYFEPVAGDYRWFIVVDTKTTFKGVNMFDPDVTVYPFGISKN